MAREDIQGKEDNIQPSLEGQGMKVAIEDMSRNIRGNKYT